MLKLSQQKLATFLPIALQADVVPMITSSAGMGKSSIVKQVADNLNLQLIDIRVSQLMPYDLAGLISPNADRTHAEYLPVNLFPLETTPLPEGKQGFLLFMDEFNSGDKSTLAAAYKLVLDRKIGEHKLHPNVRIVCAGNRIQDRAIVNKLGSALQSRLVHIEMELQVKEFMEYITNSNWNNLVVSYLNFRPHNIHNFDPNEVDEVITYTCPRTWEFVNKLLNNDLLDLGSEIYSTVLHGTIGEKAATDFIAYLNVYKDLPEIHLIETDPLNAPMPDDSNIGAKWALAAYIADNFTTTNMNALIAYLERLRENDLKVLSYRMGLKKCGALIQNTAVQKSLKGISAKLKP